MGGCHAGLPDLTLLNLAVTQQCVDPVGLAGVLGCQSHAGGNGNALTQRASGHIHAGNHIHVGVTLQVGVNVTEGEQVFHREETTVGQYRVQTGGGVTLGQHKAVAILPPGILGVDVQFLEIQIGIDLGCGQRAAGMARLCAVGGFNYTHANLAGSDLQLLLFTGSHVFPPSFYPARFPGI